MKSTLGFELTCKHCGHIWRSPRIREICPSCGDKSSRTSREEDNCTCDFDPKDYRADYRTGDKCLSCGKRVHKLQGVISTKVLSREFIKQVFHGGGGAND